MTTERNIAVTTHGRCLLRQGPDASRVLLGFHGYGEAAEEQMARLEAIPGSDRWTCVSVQGLHRFYRRRGDDIVASWMTRQDRELMIVDNVEYVSAVIDALAAPPGAVIAFAGFSQGVSMAFRAACRGRYRAAAILACGGDVPPELDASAFAAIGHALIGRGRADEAYPAPTFARDVLRLRDAGVDVEPVEYDGGHEWTPAFAAAAGAVLKQLE